MAKSDDTDTITRFKIDGDAYELDLEQLEFGEIVEIERFLDKPWAEVVEGRWQSSVSVTVILAYLAKKKAEPLTTLDSVLASKQIEVVGNRPTQAGGENGRRSSTKSPASSRGKSSD